MLRSRAARLAAIVAAAVSLAACSSPVAEGASPVSPSATVDTPAAATPAIEVPVVQATVPPPAPQAAAPEEFRIAAAGVTMPAVAVGVQADGSMEIPADPGVAGWYRFGAAPADGKGTTVLAAHVDSRVYGLGPLAGLRDVPEGAEVFVRDAAGVETRYIVRSVTYVPRAQLPVDELFDRDGAAALAIITCGGSFDERTRTYSDNVVLVADAAL